MSDDKQSPIPDARSILGHSKGSSAVRYYANEGCRSEEERMQQLIDSFPCLARCGIRWTRTTDGSSSADFIAQMKGMSSGEREAALFILTVWDSHGVKPNDSNFNVVSALCNWSAGERAAFLNWASKPWQM